MWLVLFGLGNVCLLLCIFIFAIKIEGGSFGIYMNYTLAFKSLCLSLTCTNSGQKKALSSGATAEGRANIHLNLFVYLPLPVGAHQL